jgi:hypothetical protein
VGFTRPQNFSALIVVVVVVLLFALFRNIVACGRGLLWLFVAASSAIYEGPRSIDRSIDRY